MYSIPDLLAIAACSHKFSFELVRGQKQQRSLYSLRYCKCFELTVFEHLSDSSEIRKLLKELIYKLKLHLSTDNTVLPSFLTVFLSSLFS